MEIKLKKHAHPWIANKFNGVHVFVSGLDSGHLGSGVAIIMNNSLAKHVYKVSEISSQLLSVKLLFRNKLSVSVLGLYAGASLAACFSQASKINFFVAKAMNDSSFVILGNNFNEDGFHRCASFKKCFSLDLVNTLNGSLFSKLPMWCNFCGVAKMIDYMFVSSGLVNAIVDCSMTDVVEFFNTDHKAVSISMGLGGLLDTWLSVMCKQANKDCWKFDVKSADVLKWDKFGDMLIANVSVFLDEFALLESKCAKESQIRQAITRHMESFVLDKGHTIRSILEHLFHKVMLDHLVVSDELVLEPELVKSRVDVVMEG
ncbi:hypothetical protein G9A89_008742 [Geosiphon pyriformis]|nr:hypothetical protein G9A89_008742 [Geosiphon pyriformis]